MTTVLIDGDIVSYRCAAASENEEFNIAWARAQDLMTRITAETNASEYEIYLTGSDNFRYSIYPDYKANRTQPRPKWLEEIRENFIVNYKAKLTCGYEADDALAIRHTELGENSVIASIDKDMRQLPGWFYSWEIRGTSVNGKPWVRPAELVQITPTEGLKSFYRGLLIGDRSDNIIGVQGIGEVKAAKWIDPLTTELEMFDTVRTLYEDDDRLYINGQLMWLLRKEGKYWHPPNGRTLDLKASSLVLLEQPQEDGQ